MLKSVILARIERHPAVKPVALRTFDHLDKPWPVVKPETGAEDFVEDIDDSWVRQHPAKWLTPWAVQGEWILLQLPTPCYPHQLFGFVG